MQTFCGQLFSAKSVIKHVFCSFSSRPAEGTLQTSPLLEKQIAEDVKTQCSAQIRQSPADLLLKVTKYRKYGLSHRTSSGKSGVLVRSNRAGQSIHTVRLLDESLAPASLFPSPGGTG